MISAVRRHLTLLGVIGLVLVVSLATSATAALVITGKQIKNGTVTTKDIKDGTLVVRDLSGPARKALTRGFIGSACSVPGGDSGTVVLEVAGDGTITLRCHVPPSTTDDDADGFTTTDGDCNDANPDVHPGATEITDDGIDNDCDSTVDEATG